MSHNDLNHLPNIIAQTYGKYLLIFNIDVGSLNRYMNTMD